MQLENIVSRCSFTKHTATQFHLGATGKPFHGAVLPNTLQPSFISVWLEAFSWCSFTKDTATQFHLGASGSLFMVQFYQTHCNPFSPRCDWKPSIRRPSSIPALPITPTSVYPKLQRVNQDGGRLSEKWPNCIPWTWRTWGTASFHVSVGRGGHDWAGWAVYGRRVDTTKESDAWMHGTSRAQGRWLTGQLGGGEGTLLSIKETIIGDKLSVGWH